MGNVAIQIEGLSKQYRIGRKEQYRTFRDVLTNSVTAPFQRVRGLLRGNASAAANLTDTIWALKDVSFSVKQGEVIGLIGHNGAGKSTLLKILSRITEPTEGRAEVFGRVGALLEVGTGFHPELTGRENVYLNGAILGMGRQEIERKFDEIVAFAEIDKFIDTPVKYYSSGMGLRLGFAVAAHLEPEILIVDEVLAVGDAAFQKKCLGKMTEVAGGGRTVLFVSHNLPAVQGLCSKVIRLHGGTVAAEGDPGTIISEYLQSVASINTDQTWPDMETAPGNKAIRLHKAQIRAEAATPDSPITTSTPIAVEFEYWNLKPGARLNLSVKVENSQGYLVFNTASLHEPTWNGKPFPEGLFKSTFQIPGDLLNDGWHKIDVMFVEDVQTSAYVKENVLAFDVIDSGVGRGDWYGKWPGVVRPLLNWSTEYLGEKIEA